MIYLIVGPMGCGKSASLIEISKISKVSRILCFKPKLDSRSEKIESRNGESLEAYQVENFSQILEIIKVQSSLFTNSILIDEIQFIKTEGLLEFVKYVNNRWGMFVHCAGLNLTSSLEPFETTANVAMYADVVVHKYGKCEYCENESQVTKCKVEKDSEVLIGGDEIYTQTCYRCHSL